MKILKIITADQQDNQISLYSKQIIDIISDITNEFSISGNFIVDISQKFNDNLIFGLFFENKEFNIKQLLVEFDDNQLNPLPPITITKIINTLPFNINADIIQQYH